jgi:hypothetical protein
MPGTGTVEVVRGSMSDEQAAALLRFWERNGALRGDAAKARLAQVVCLLADGDGEVVGANSVYPAAIESVGGVTFWVYRSLLMSEATDAGPAMVKAAFDALEAEFDPEGDGPAGLCLLVDDRDLLRRRPEAEWSDPRLLYAGYLEDGRQVRVAYFEDARIGPGGFVPNVEWPPVEGCRIEVFAEQDRIDEQAVIDFWAREGAVQGEEARRRLGELHLVVGDEEGELVALTSAFATRNPKLGMDLWHYRGFVGASHRRTGIGVHISMAGRDDLRERYESGRDRRAGGVVYVVQNPALKRMNNANWLPPDFTFVGEDQLGAHLRVHYFPGAPAPPPPR